VNFAAPVALSVKLSAASESRRIFLKSAASPNPTKLCHRVPLSSVYEPPSGETVVVPEPIVCAEE